MSFPHARVPQRLYEWDKWFEVFDPFFDVTSSLLAGRDVAKLTNTFVDYFEGVVDTLFHLLRIDNIQWITHPTLVVTKPF